MGERIIIQRLMVFSHTGFTLTSSSCLMTTASLRPGGCKRSVATAARGQIGLTTSDRSFLSKEGHDREGWISTLLLPLQVVDVLHVSCYYGCTRLIALCERELSGVLLEAVPKKVRDIATASPPSVSQPGASAPLLPPPPQAAAHLRDSSALSASKKRSGGLTRSSPSGSADTPLMDSGSSPSSSSDGSYGADSARERGARGWPFSLLVGEALSDFRSP